MSFLDVLEECRIRGIQLALKNGSLLSRDPQKRLDADLRAQLSVHKAEIVAWLENSGRTDTPIPVVPREGRLPLSFAQQRLWLVAELDPSADRAYHLPSALRLIGDLDSEALKSALDALVARHEVLRTRFPADDGRPHQVIGAAHEGFSLHEETASSDDAVEQAIRAELATPFDRVHGPLIRGRLLRLATNEHVLVLNQHHIVSDGWSNAVFVQELAELYRAACLRETAVLAELPVQYADYASWQREMLQGKLLSRQLDFWRGHLAGVPALLELPHDRARPARPSHAGSRVSLSVPRSLTAALRALAHRRGATLYMVSMAAWSLLLSRLSGQSSVVVATPVAGRSRRELEGLIGFFVNTLPFRTRVDAGTRVTELVDAVRRDTLAAFAHQDVPFEQIVEAVQPSRSLSHAPLAQASFTWHNEPEGGALALPGLTLASIDIEQPTTQADLSLHLRDNADTLEGTLVYATDLLDESTVLRWGQSFIRLLEGFVADDAQDALRLPMLVEADRERIVQGFNDVPAALPEASFAHACFEHRVDANEEAIALEFEGERLTYRELDEKANRLAHYLIAQGATPDSRVALCVERGIDFVVGVLGTLKAGCAYVPLDPQYPAARMAFMLADSAPSLILTQASVADQLPPVDVPVLRLDVDVPILTRKQPATRPRVSALRPEHLAYLIYTSGSTGLPKAVAIEHRQLCHLAAAQQSIFGDLDGARVLQFASPSFDASVWEWAMALLGGGTLCLASRQQLMPGTPLAATLRDASITHLTLPGSALLALGDELLPDLRTLVVAGEACPVALAARWQDRVAFYNAYGPTEVTVCASIERCVDLGRLSVPIGRALPNVRVHVLDASGYVVPVGVVGEIHVGGAGVARGYLGREDLTSERFIPDHVGGAPGERLYRTGDLGRYLADGRLEYVGRIDFQVKLRGHRIETGEIDTLLSGLSGVADAVVLLTGEGVDAQLVAYWVPVDGVSEETASTLRGRLAGLLPDYMLPSRFVRMASLPRTDNGKLDRAALPTGDEGVQAQREYEAPEGPMETSLAALWQELLGVARVGRHDHFFELGGHSLTAVQLASRLRESVGVEMPLRLIFSEPTLAALAATLPAPVVQEPPPCPVPRGQMLPLSLAQQRLWFVDRFDRRASLSYHLPLALRLYGALDVDALKGSLARIWERHDILRCHFPDEGGIPHLAFSQSPFELPLDDLSARGTDAGASEVRALARSEARTAFDFANGPLVRARLLRLAAEDHVLLVTMHHVISDGWSLAIMVQEIGALYPALRAGRPDPLPPLPIQYADYAQWQRDRMLGERLTRATTFWRDHLSGAPALIDLPLDRPRPPIQEHGGDRVRFDLPADLVKGVRQLAERHGATLYMTLMSAWAIVLSRITGQNDLVIGTPVAGRQHKEVEGLIGFFVNTLALRVRLPAATTVASVINAVKDTALAAFAHQELPFEQVVEAVQPKRSTSHAALAQVSFTWHNEPDGGPLVLPGLTLSPVEQEPGDTHFDLSLHLTDLGDRFAGMLIYAEALFERSTIDHIATLFTRVLRGIVHDTETTVDALPLLDSAQRDTGGADFLLERVPGERVHERFESWVGTHPDAPALSGAGEALSYGELNVRANVLAHHMRNQGVGPDRRVAIVAERGVDFVVAVLATLKSGGAYVPLDPAMPHARLSSILAECDPALLLIQSDVEDVLPALDCTIVRIDTDMPVLSRRLPSTDPAPHPDASAGDLCYVIYTSGSTGTPKGVMVEHPGVLNMALAHGELLDLVPDDRILQFAALSFDVCAAEIMMALAHGACLHVAPRTELQPGGALERLLETDRITVAMLPVAALAACLPHELPDMRRLVVGGDVCPPALAARWRQGRKLFNVYGPTEATVAASAHECQDDASGRLPIGRALTNVRLHLLDERQQPVPAGVVAEICIGGVGVARGYLGRPQESQARFLADPFDPAPGARLYRTGDLGRWRSDGLLEFLGRHDDQVKVRGFRIELGEIEGRLLACDGVAEAATALFDLAGSKQVAAYVTAREGATLDVDGLRSELARHLPDYMQPSAYIVLDRLPLTANGKLDRTALPAPHANDLGLRPYEAPQGDIEDAVAQIWQELLDQPRIGRHDHFFDLGGHSLLVVSLVERLRAVRLVGEVSAIFSSPTLAGYAACLRRADERGSTQEGDGFPLGTTTIEPAMVDLVDLTQGEIDRLVTAIPGGAPNIKDIYPLMPLQDGMLFHHLLESRGDTYLSRSQVAFEHREGVDRFLAALQEVVDHHDILRCAFVWEGVPRPVQVVQRNARLPVYELRVDDGQDAVRFLDARTDPRHTRLDLRRAPLLAAYVVEDRVRGEWLLSLLYHHILGDRTASELVRSELGRRLQSNDTESSSSPSLRSLIAQAASVPASQYEAYFREILAGVDDSTAPFGILDTQLTSAELRTAQRHLPAALAAALREASRLTQVSPASLFHVAFARVLHACTGRDDVVFGTVLSGRLQGAEGADRAVGMFINMLPVRFNVARKDVKQAVRDGYRQLLDLLSHEQAPLALAQRCADLPATLPLFTSMFNYRHSRGTASLGKIVPVMSGIRILHTEEAVNYPVSMSVDDDGTGFILTAQCVAAIDPEALCGYLEEVLAAMPAALSSANPSRLEAIDVLPDSERVRLVRGLNATTEAYPRESRIHTLFEAQVLLRPDAVALVFEGVSLSYGQLNARANRLAHYLIAQGVGADDRVAVCSERSIELVVSLLAILKAGGAYVPLDPEQPSERLAFVLEDSAPKVLLTQSAWASRFAGARVPQQVLEALEAGLAAWPSHDPVDRGEAGARDLAYVIYTSGSTGLPKGVMVEHRSVLRLVMQDRYTPIGVDDGVAHCANPAFDAATWEIWATLLHGARLLVVSSACLLDPRALATLLSSERATVLHLPAGLFHQYAEALSETFPPLNYLLFGGDRIEADKVRRVADSGRHGHLVQCYGPTETTTFASTWTVQALAKEAISVPIGRPIANTQIYILDAHGAPTPWGVSGEIHIGGDGVARGYLNRPELTAERFIADPFVAEGLAGEPSARMYKTGDLGRWLPDGTLEFLGRNDFQVKIRGFRIELGEIESRLVACEGVREAVVLAREDHPGDKRLVAYVIADGVLPEVGALRAELSTRLPEYMLPSAIVTLDAFPLTPNGKLDRKALPAPDASSLAAREYEAPQGEIEETLAGIWQSLLNVERVGRHDHFFELGGHSLLAVQLVSHVRDALGVEIALRELFAHPTLHAFTQTVSRAGVSTLGRIERVERDRPLPLSLAQQRLWFIGQLDEAANRAYHMPAALRLSGDLDRQALKAALDRLLARQEGLRARIVTLDGIPHQVFASEDEGFALAEQDLSDLPEEEQAHRVASLVTDEASSAFDFANGPLIRGRLLRLGDKEHVLLVTQHHIVSDGWSVGVMVKEFAALYAAFREDRADPLPPLAIQYADYAIWQRGWLQGEELEKQVAFWRDHLAGAPATLALPTDRPRPPSQSHAGGEHGFDIPEALTVGVRAMAQRHGTTVFNVLLATWSLLLSRLSGQDDVVVGTPVANRQRREVEGLIGFFVNTLALRVRLDEGLTVGQLLAHVSETTLAAFAHQELPFEQVVEALQPVRSLSYSPLFQAMLTLNHAQGGEAHELPGLTLSHVPGEHTVAHFDLSLSLNDGSTTMAGSLEYARDLFDRSTAVRLAGHFITLLEGMVTHDLAQVASLPIMTSMQRQRVLVDFNATTVAFPKDATIVTLFERHVAEAPARPAVVCGEVSLDHRAFNERANRLARHLRAIGIGRDDRVAVHMERGLAWAVAWLAIQKAGGVYVPLDPAYPSDRLGFMLRDSAPVVLLTEAEGCNRLDAHDARTIVVSMAGGNAWDGFDGDDLAQGPAPFDSSYLIYTSGSTGEPKGVLVEHAGLCNLAFAQGLHLGLTGAHRVLQCASQGFDASIFEMVMALCHGGTLYLPSPGATMAGEDLALSISRHAITHVTLTPAALATLRRHDELASVVTLVVAGEACSAELVRAWAPGRLFVNAYGPTEATIWSSFHACDAMQEGNPSIGRPVANTSVYLLDRLGEPVPVGVTGEIHIGGAGVARGYLGRPALTASRFVPDPFVDLPEARMYRSGDLGRWRDDGTLEFIGRNDQQVKLRGFRIEPGEIEGQLLRQPGVREAVVVSRGGRLIAYVIGDAEVSSLRRSLSDVLPDYMIPSAFVTLDTLPLTANGKLDRNALPAPDGASLVSREYEAPQGDVEDILAGIWQSLLGVERVGRHDHFFELGGHSLLIMVMIERLTAHGLQGKARDVFASPVLSDCARALRPIETRIVVPPNALTPEIGAITPELLPLVALTQEQIDRIVASVPGGVANIQDVYPLMPLQQGALFHHLLEGEGDPYLVSMLLGFSSRAYLDEFVVALDTVISRHDILRTAVLWKGLPQPVQVVYREATLPVHEVGLPGEGDARTALAERTDPRKHRIDLDRAPLLAAYIAEDTARGEWLLSLQHHHLVCDHVTLELAIEEIEALRRGVDAMPYREVPIRNLVIQTLAIPEADHAAYFRAELGDIDEPTAPFGMLDVRLDGSSPDNATVHVDAALATRVRREARRLGMSPAVLFHLAWAQVLARCTGRDDVLFGTVLSGRLQVEGGADRAWGMFINTLPLRLSTGAVDVSDALHESQRRIHSLLEHEHAALSLAQRYSGVPAPLPLFTTLLNYRHGLEKASGDVAASPVPGMWRIAGDEITNYPIAMIVDDAEESFAVTAQVLRTDQVQAVQLAGYMVRALEGIVGALEIGQPVLLSSVDVLAVEERRHLIEDLGITAASAIADVTLHQLFEERVASAANQTAVVCEDGSLSYGELNAQANRLAHHLVAQGVKPDDRVAICLERSLDMVVGLMAILKSGAAYVPLDPSNPSGRLADMLADSAPRVLLMSRNAMPVPSDVPVWMLDDDKAAWSGASTENPTVVGLSPSHLAYVIYTSGSTGQPKGVMNEHRGIVNRLRWMQDAYELDASDTVLQKTPFGFDVSVWEFFWPLLNGARLVMARPDGHKDPAYLAEAIREHGITTLHFVPSMLQAFLDSGAGANLPSLRRLLCSGEALPGVLARRTRQAFPDVGLHNLYGPTEAAVDVTAWHCADADLPDNVPIGRPIANTAIYLLDRYGVPVPRGVAGEIHIGGVQVARGYLNRAELTAERFVTDPFAGTPGARMYKTGDLGRWRPDGAIEFLGRNDHQIKIRGFRIELGEIEARLAACAGVRDSVVVARADDLGSQHLVAYLVMEAESERVAGNLRSELLATLPEYMVPGAFVMLDALPLTPNGKLDRRALPSTDSALRVQQAYRAPESVIEIGLVEILTSLLAVERIGLDDDFFALGGHSLLATTLSVHVRERFHVELSLKSVFVDARVESIAHAIEAAQVALLSAQDISSMQAELESLSDEELQAFMGNTIQ